MKFPDLVHAVKPEPATEIPQGQSAHDSFWDFISLMPESTHMIAWQLSDRTIPRSYRTMQGPYNFAWVPLLCSFALSGFGVNTFVLVNGEGKRSYVKFHWTPHLGTHSLVWDECLKINGQDPDYHRRDLYDAIKAGAYPKWELGVQIIPIEDEDKLPYDILDCTKYVPEEDYPIKNIGTMELNRNVTDYFAETEQVAFCTSNIVPGIDYCQLRVSSLSGRPWTDAYLPESQRSYAGRPKLLVSRYPALSCRTQPQADPCQPTAVPVY